MTDRSTVAVPRRGGNRTARRPRSVAARLHVAAIRETLHAAHARTQFDPAGHPGRLAVSLKCLPRRAGAPKAARIATRYDEAAA